MKKTSIFKTLVDLLYVLHFCGLIGIFFILPSGIVNINQANLNVEDWNVWEWSIVVLNLIAYLIFLRGLFFLRKMAKFLLSKKYFSNQVITNLKHSGYYFVFTAIMTCCIQILIFMKKLYLGRLEFIFDANMFIILFLFTIGLFFIIQSHTLLMAKHFKEEHELTI
ncbi:DUF2975 domain-containing protein [Formosa sediminum]|uniref:DUF2975 domain-containing protein n=1 Tax=Formosa sediminum TaxID=2594004 RepID=A0A516GSS0_9FLAO|nr:DUF2975 domain-containing protein [Formosa sediminum]QDO94555.1 DUF2975 domain-containing protein [Formosa sediminum]